MLERCEPEDPLHTELIKRVKPLPARKIIAHSLSSFDVTTDSVVAKATVITSEDTRRIFIDWGDGQNDTINIIPGRLGQFNVFDRQPAVPLPKGTFEIYHAYAESENRRSFTHTILLHVEDTNGGDDIRLKTISLTPRYRIIHYQSRFQIPEACDVGKETQKFKVVMYLNDAEIHNYSLNIQNSPAGSVLWHLLEDSQLSQEISADTQPDEIARIRFKFTEFDWIFNDYGQYSVTLSYTMETGVVEQAIILSDSVSETCRINIHYDREVSLIANIPSIASPLAFYAP